MPPSTSSILPSVPTVDAELLARLRGEAFPPVIDLRSPSEFADDHLPGAVNVPLFDDAERALVGFLYKQHSPDEAFTRGLDIVTAKINAIVTGVARAAGWNESEADLPARVRAMSQGGIVRLDQRVRESRVDRLPAGALLVHCWRGGLRSRSVAALLRSIGHTEVICLGGGYRAWRRQVLEGLAAWQAPPAFVLRGLTGVGKTLVLRALEARRPGLTLDLEGLAGHRSSLLGMVGLQPCSQKAFDSRLFERLKEGHPGRVVLEGESRKVGDVVIPPSVWSALQSGSAIELTAPTERRVAVLIEDYLADDASRPQLARQLAAIETRMPSRPPLVELLESGREEELVELLLEQYYDPLYRHSEGRREYALRIDSSDPDRAAQRILEYLEEGAGLPSSS